MDVWRIEIVILAIQLRIGDKTGHRTTFNYIETDNAAPINLCSCSLQAALTLIESLMCNLIKDFPVAF